MSATYREADQGSSCAKTLHKATLQKKPFLPHPPLEVDDGTGFVQKRSKKRTVGGVETRQSGVHACQSLQQLSVTDVRDAVYMYGLRLIVDSSGIGRQISLAPRLKSRTQGRCEIDVIDPSQGAHRHPTGFLFSPGADCVPWHCKYCACSQARKTLCLKWFFIFWS